MKTNYSKIKVSLIFIIVFMLVCIYYYNKLEEPSLLSGNDLNEISFIDEWSKFRESTGFSEEAKVETFTIIYTKNKILKSIRFRIVEQTSRNEYTVLSLSKGYSITANKENYEKVEINKVKGVINKKLVSVNKFLNNIELLISNGDIFTGSIYKYYGLYFTGELAKVRIRGDYYEIRNEQISSITRPQENKLDNMSYYIHIAGANELNNGFGSNDTRIILFREY
ncbi:hypothetical protein [Sporosalibacterium faouarense]|uniref:hypothetical protein n=1 Tax=Sporosalibacterium faouarense TaxID=516123 RepID=UPI001A9C66D5|nr:hypothetical protein [Sporosalibacterium faouarense]